MGRRDIALVLNQAGYGELRTTILLSSPAGYFTATVVHVMSSKQKPY
jgi:hypothetical protein